MRQSGQTFCRPSRQAATGPAAQQGVEADAIRLVPAGHARVHLRDPGHRLVAHHEARFSALAVAEEAVDVRAADAGGRDLQHDFACARSRRSHLLDLHLFRADVDESLHGGLRQGASARARGSRNRRRTRRSAAAGQERHLAPERGAARPRAGIGGSRGRSGRAPMARTRPAMFARIVKSRKGEADRMARTPQTENSDQDAVVDGADAARPLRAPGGSPSTRVGDRAHQDVGVAELGLEQDPEAVEEGEEPEARPDLLAGTWPGRRRRPGPAGRCRGGRSHVARFTFRYMPRKQKSPHTQIWSTWT